jgi:hypothetical protein
MDLVELIRDMSSVYKIPFNKPTITGKELFYISQATHNGYSAGDAGFTQKCHTLLESILIDFNMIWK